MDFLILFSGFLIGATLSALIFTRISKSLLNNLRARLEATEELVSNKIEIAVGKIKATTPVTVNNAPDVTNLPPTNPPSST